MNSCSIPNTSLHEPTQLYLEGNGKFKNNPWAHKRGGLPIQTWFQSVLLSGGLHEDWVILSEEKVHASPHPQLQCPNACLGACWSTEIVWFTGHVRLPDPESLQCFSHWRNYGSTSLWWPPKYFSFFPEETAMPSSSLFPPSRKPEKLSP